MSVAFLDGDSSNISNFNRVDTVWLHAGLLARNQIQKNAPGRLKLDGVDERVGADVQKRDEDHGVGDGNGWPHVRRSDDQVEHERRQPRNHEKPANEEHGLDDVGLHLTGLALSCARSLGRSVAGHGIRSTTNDHEHAPVAEDEDAENHDEER